MKCNSFELLLFSLGRRHEGKFDEYAYHVLPGYTNCYYFLTALDNVKHEKLKSAPIKRQREWPSEPQSQNPCPRGSIRDDYGNCEKSPHSGVIWPW